MARRQAPTTCTDDDCTHDAHVRRFDREARLGTKRHPDSNAVESVCSIHGIVWSR